MKPLLTLAGAGLILASASAQAQDAQGSAEPMQTQEIPPAQTPQTSMDPDSVGQESMDPEMTSPSFTDDQIAGFARAAMQMRDLNADTAMDETARRAQAETIIAAEGLDPQTYSAIGAAAAGDPATAMRIQQAIEEMSEQPEG